MQFLNDRLYFENIPLGYKDKERVYYIGIEFSGIQNYIFGEMDVTVNPTEIGKRSSYVIALTNIIDLELSKEFSKYGYTNISKASGKLFSVLKKGLSIEELVGYLDELQINVYEATGGKLEIYFGIKKVILKTASDNDVKRSVHGDLIKDIEYNKFRCVNILVNSVSDYKKYEISKVLSIDSQEKKERINNLGNSFSVIKYDLDNLGNFFKNIVKSDILQEVSQSLNKAIELSVKDTPHVINLFTGGDDILLLCPTERVFFCTFYLQKKLREHIEAEEKLTEYAREFSVSGGIQVINNNLPILVYSRKAEEQLEHSKDGGKNKITVNDVSLTWPELEKLGELVEKNVKSLKERWPSEYIDFYNDVANLIRRIEKVGNGKNLLEMKRFKELFDGR